MAIVQTVDFSTFVQSFEDSQYQNNFTREGLRVLFDYLENLSEDIGKDIDFDIGAIVCDYCESSIEEIILDYSITIDSDWDTKEQILDFLSNETIICGITETGFVFACF